MALNDVDGAAESFEKALKLEPNDSKLTEFDSVVPKCEMICEPTSLENYMSS